MINKSEVLKKVRYIEIKTRRLVEEVLSGAYESAFKGRGIEFHQVRDYTFGDDFRAIDWNTSARTGKLHIKEFIEERELTVILAVDMSGSQFFGTRRLSKIDVIIELCAALGFSAIKNNDRVGLLLFDDEVEKYIPPKKGKKSILRIISDLMNINYSLKRTNIALALKFLNNILKRKSIVFLFSDFFDEGYEKDLILSARKHDFIGFSVFDTFEINPTKATLLSVKDIETGQVGFIDLGSKKEVNQIKKSIDGHLEKVNTFFRKNGIDYISMNSAESYERALISFFKKRERRYHEI